MDFDIDALYQAVDERRRARGLSWAQTAREVNAAYTGIAAGTRSVAASTISGMRSKRVIEADGVLQTLRWLDRCPESFVSGAAETPLPEPPPDRILRFDTRKIYELLDAQRIERNMTWAAVAREIGGLGPASLTRLAKGGRTAFPDVMRILKWLNRSAASVTRLSLF
jgi:hypothetical protein